MIPLKSQAKADEKFAKDVKDEGTPTSDDVEEEKEPGQKTRLWRGNA